MTDVQKEKEKYTKVWDHDEYRNSPSPGGFITQRLPVIEWLKEEGVVSILDAGCGEGKFMRSVLRSTKEFTLHGMDITDNSIDPKFVAAGMFTQGCLWNTDDYKTKHDSIVCVDVLEHIPKKYVASVFKSFYNASNKCIMLSICLVDDVLGEKLLGEKLHLTVETYEWWLEQVKAAGFKVKYAFITPMVLDVFAIK